MTDITQTFDHGALHWIREGLDETLQIVRHALETYTEEGENQEQIDRCIKNLHQVLGTLRMVQVYGGGMLVDEMEQTAQGIKDKKVTSVGDAASAIMMGVVQLPLYLERISVGEPDIPLVLLPILNELRAARRASLVSEISLFAPKLTQLIESESVVAGSGNIELPGIIKKVRGNYHRALLQWFRGADSHIGLNNIQKIFAAINARAETPRLRRLLEAAEALVISLLEKEVAESNAVKQLFGGVDRVFKCVIEQGEDQGLDDFPIELLKNILYYVAGSQSLNPVVRGVQQSADVANSFPVNRGDGDASLVNQAAGQELFSAVGEALAGDLQVVKDQFDLYTRGEERDHQKLVEVATVLQRVGDTLGMIGQGELHTLVRDRLEQITDQEKARNLNANDLMDIAADILKIESALESLDIHAQQHASGNQSISDGEMQGHLKAVLSEVFTEFAKVKTVIDEYLSAPDKVHLLSSIPDSLKRVGGALLVADIEPVAELLAGLKTYIEALLNGQANIPDTPTKDAIADVITGSEFYLEAVLGGGSGLESILLYAEPALNKLTKQIEDETVINDAADAEESLLVGGNSLILDEESELGEESELIDTEILEIFVEEADEAIVTIKEEYPQWRENQSNDKALAKVRRAFHTLKGSGRLVNAKAIGEFSWAIENLLNRVIEGSVETTPEVFTVIDHAVATLPRLLDAQKRNDFTSVAVADIEQQAHALAKPKSVASAELPEQKPRVIAEPPAVAKPETAINVKPAVPCAISMDLGLYDVFRAEAKNHLMALGKFINYCRSRVNSSEYTSDLSRALHTLTGSGRTANVAPMAELSGAMEAYVNQLIENETRTSIPVIDLLDKLRERLHAIIDVINMPGAEIPEWQMLFGDIRRRHEQLNSPDPDPGPGSKKRQAPVPEADHDNQPEAKVEPEPESQISSMPAPTPKQWVDRRAEKRASDVFDVDVLDVFLEEATELSAHLEQMHTDWEKKPDNEKSVAAIQRDLHTLKGGARLAGVMSMGDLSHAMESLFEAMSDGSVQTTQELQQLSRHALDYLLTSVEFLNADRIPDKRMLAVVPLLEAAAKKQPWEIESLYDDSILLPDSDTEALQDSQLLNEESILNTELLTETEALLLTDTELLGDEAAASDDSVIPFPQKFNESQGKVRKRPVALGQEDDSNRVKQEVVRVRSNTLDDMVNYAGEVSIYRSRLEQQNTNLDFNLDELGNTVNRLQEQLRGLELETEAQILSRHQRENEGEQSDFDPLEMDRYSSLQQLSRGLSETVDDLTNIGESLQDLSRENETLLVQQARINNDLQDGLLRTRMVPLQSQVPKLQRLVRQTSHNLGKQAELVVNGAEGEMDRAILNRIIPAFEHLLRNAVAHGVETPDIRKTQHKPEVAQVSMTLTRDAGDVLIAIADDGAGLDLGAIKSRAIERGLMDADATVEDADLYQFILEPGFSTAEGVTQIAGRGVGMDAVLSQIKQLGGSLDIRSTLDEGAIFEIRLPFTLAITEALLARVGNEVFAIPHGSVNAVIRGSIQQLSDGYAEQATPIIYDGNEYTLKYVGTMLGLGTVDLSNKSKHYPLLLVHSGEHRVALHVDELLGNSQIVVKSVGQQLSTIRWFTGGTILADGTVALILDTAALVRLDAAKLSRDQENIPAVDVAEDNLKVMVVDDSITVRKVTRRLLERHNMVVSTAKDGVDALAKLQESKPDLLLLDIEMPRMDGFELARHMLSTPDLSSVPILMITSRTGDKHRKLAMDLGVKRYLGKPYQETVLLENIYQVLAENS